MEVATKDVKKAGQFTVRGLLHDQDADEASYPKRAQVPDSFVVKSRVANEKRFLKQGYT